MITSSAAYDHTQRAPGAVIRPIIVFALFAAILGPVVVKNPSPPPYIWMVIAGAMVLAALSLATFSRLRIWIGDGTIRWGFGYGFPSFSLRLSDVASAKVVRNPWFYGLGVHITPRGMLYNVWGTAAIEIVRTDGRRVRLGTNEPDALVAAIDKARTGGSSW